jgi:hypothetical protein
MNTNNPNPKDYDPLELATDVIIKHGITNGALIDDIVSIVQEAYGDGWCNGYNDGAGLETVPHDHLEWWETQDADEDWVDSHDLADLEAFYGEMDLHYLQEMLEQIDQMEATFPPLTEADLPPGFPFDRKKKDE